MHPRYLSNAFVVGDGRGGAAVMVDSGAPVTPLLQFASTHGLTLTHLLRPERGPRLLRELGEQRVVWRRHPRDVLLEARVEDVHYPSRSTDEPPTIASSPSS